MLPRLLLLISVLVPGLSSIEGQSASHAGLRTLSGQDRRVLREASLSLRRQSLTQVQHWLSRKKDVRTAALGADAKTLNIVFDDGANAAILPAWPRDTRRSWAIPLMRNPMSTEGNPSPSQKALVLEPFASDEIGTHDADPEINVLQANGFKVDQLSDTSVTVDEMASLWKYNVVYLHTHAGVNSAGYSVFSTGQVANGDPAVEQLIKQGTVMVVSVSGLAQQYYGVLIPFIQQNENQFPANSMLYLDTCDLGHADPLWEAFASKGVGAMITWDGHSIFRDETAAAQAFFAAMGQGDTITGALRTVHSAGLDISAWDGKVAKLGFFGDGYITLHGRVADAPTNTLVPAVTSTPTVGPTATLTASPSPTATQIPVKVSLKQRSVTPGQRQIINITSSAELAITTEVTFPNGDQLSREGVTNQEGALRFSYMQRGSKIRHGDSSATVSVKAGDGAALSVSTKTYHIGFGPIDASVVPRTQTAGKPVTIWIHSKPFSDISLKLAQARNTLDEMTGRTGPHGWLHRRYLARRRGPQGEQLVLRAVATAGSHQFRTSTSFTVK